MILPTLEIAAMAAAAKADLVEKNATELKETRFETAITLALLKRANEYVELGFRSTGQLASAKGLEPRDWSLMLAIGKRVLDLPELDAGFRDGSLNWSKIRALLPVVNRENVEEWVDLARTLTSNQVEREVSRFRDPSVGGPTHMLILRIVIYQQLQELANGLRRASGEKDLSDEECICRLIEEVKSLRRALLRASDASAEVAARVAAATAAAAAPLACGAAPAAQDGAGRSRRIPAEIRREALVRARFVCEFCKNRYGAEIHHVIPFSHGGSHDLANLIVLCSRCHQKLHDDERRDAGTTDAACGADGTDHEPRDPLPSRGTRSLAAPPARSGSAPSHGRAGHADAPAEERAGAGHGRAESSAAARPVGPPPRSGGHLPASEVGTSRPPGTAIPPGEIGASTGARPPGAKDSGPSDGNSPGRAGRGGDTSSWRAAEAGRAPS